MHDRDKHSECLLRTFNQGFTLAQSESLCKYGDQDEKISRTN